MFLSLILLLLYARDVLMILVSWVRLFGSEALGILHKSENDCEFEVLCVYANEEDLLCLCRLSMDFCTYFL